MARRLKKLPSLSNVAKGSTATLELPRGLSYHQILLKYSGVTLSQLKDIRMEVDGKTFQSYKDGEQLEKINHYFARGDAQDSFIALHFARSEMNDLAQRRLFALGTADISTLALRVDVDAEADSPKLEAYGLEAEQEPFGYVTKIKHFPVAFSTGGLHEVDNLPTPASARIAAIHLMTSDVTHAELEVNGHIAFQAPKALEGKIQSDAGRQPSVDKFTLDFIKENDFAQSQVLAEIQDFRIRMQVAKATSFDIVVEYFDIKAGL